MLRRKGGHVYTPAVSAPGMGEMGDMGPELDDEMIMQQQQQMMQDQLQSIREQEHKHQQEQAAKQQQAGLASVNQQSSIHPNSPFGKAFPQHHGMQNTEHSEVSGNEKVLK